MTRSPQRVFVAALGALATLSFVVIPAVRADQQPQGAAGAQQQPAAPTGPMAPEKYKNIMVLTNVPADQLDITMRYVAASLGVQCNFCHVRDQATNEFQFDKDDVRQKGTAREMMKMVQTVNAGNFGVTIGCGTCHAGHNQPPGLQLAQMATPEDIAALAARQGGAGRGAGGPGGAPGARGGAPGGGFQRGQAPPAPPVDDIFNKYFAAVGGADKLQSLVLTGTMTNRFAQTSEFTIEQKAPNRYRFTQKIGQNESVTGFDGTEGWTQAGTRIADLAGFQLEQALRLSDLGLVARLKAKYPQLQASGRPQRVNNADATVVTGRAGVTFDQLFFDNNTGLLVRRRITTRTPLGSMSEQVDYTDFRDVNGVKVPFLITRSSWNQLDKLEVTDAKPNAQIDDAKFAKPKAQGN